MYQYAGIVYRVVDGDTYEIELDLGFRILSRQVIRLRGVNCPELHPRAVVDGVTRTPKQLEDERHRARSAAEYATRLLNGATVRVTTTVKDVTFGRWVGDVQIGGVSVADELVNAGHAVRA